MVANKFLEELDMEDKMRAQCVSMCQHFHQSVRTLSDQYFATLRRQNYVTPTSYLELILTFKSLLSKKRNEIVLMKKRYTVGLEKLEFAASQVSVMQQELQELQPELVKTQKETEQLMVKIERDTIEAEAKKEVREEGVGEGREERREGEGGGREGGRGRGERGEGERGEGGEGRI